MAPVQMFFYKAFGATDDSESVDTIVVAYDGDTGEVVPSVFEVVKTVDYEGNDVSAVTNGVDDAAHRFVMRN